MENRHPKDAGATAVTALDLPAGMDPEALARALEPHGVVIRSAHVSTASPGPSLTMAERRVLAAFLCYDRLEEISQRLGVSYHTTETHTRNILRKLGVRSRTRAVGHALLLGILPLELVAELM